VPDYGDLACGGSDVLQARRENCAMKIILWIVFIIFLIGLAVVLGLGKLIF